MTNSTTTIARALDAYADTETARDVFFASRVSLTCLEGDEAEARGEIKDYVRLADSGNYTVALYRVSADGGVERGRESEDALKRHERFARRHLEGASGHPS